VLVKNIHYKSHDINDLILILIGLTNFVEDYTETAEHMDELP